MEKNESKERTLKISLGYFILTILFVKKDFTDPVNVIIAIGLSIVMGLIISIAIDMCPSLKKLIKRLTTKGKKQP